jgi:UDPglucose--hexose-1-phosphate uridylyltransferase
MCNILKNELERGKGIITENEDIAAFVPSFTECPYGVYIVSKNHRSSLCELCKSEKLNFAGIIKDITGTYDALFGSRFPYMMYMHQSPVNGDGSENKFHFHVEFYSPVRSEKSLKINASGETGAWAHVNPTAPEEKAEELREAYERL